MELEGAPPVLVVVSFPKPAHIVTSPGMIVKLFVPITVSDDDKNDTVKIRTPTVEFKRVWPLL